MRRERKAKSHQITATNKNQAVSFLLFSSQTLKKNKKKKLSAQQCLHCTSIFQLQEHMLSHCNYKVNVLVRCSLLCATKACQRTAMTHTVTCLINPNVTAPISPQTPGKATEPGTDGREEGGAACTRAAMMN